MDLNMASGVEEINVTVTNKDEHVPTMAYENGYESECSSSSRSEADVARSALEIEADAFTRFIERQRVEVMFELRNIRLGERPVTGQPNRGRIETFLHNIQEQQQQRQPARAPSTRPAVPSAHIADINALANRRCVSAALGSAAFRQDLENAIRRSIETHPITPVQQIPRAPPLPPTFGSTNTDQQHSPIVQNQPPLPLQTPTVFREEARPQMVQTVTHEPLNIERQERELHAWQTITQLQREIIVIEISDLVHRQLVTSALESDFRSHLEHHYLNRLQQGPTPQEDQQTVPVATTQRVAPTPFVTRTTTANTRASDSTLSDLSSRFEQMQTMMQMMFTMQMDMQRSLRQEVAGAMANTSLSTITSANHPMNAGHCTVCLNAIADTVLYRCGHLCVCYMCGLNLQATPSANGVKCPICRAPVDDILRVYRSSRDGE